MFYFKKKFTSGFSKYLANTSWLLAERVLQVITGLVLIVWIARYLGPNKFGLLSYAQSFASFFIIISKFGLDQIVVRDLVKDKSVANKILGSAFVIKLIGATIALVLMTISLFIIPSTNYEKMLILVITSSVIFQSFQVIDFYFQSKVLSRFIVFVNIGTLFISSCLKLIFILNQMPLEYFAAIAIVDSMLMAIGYIYIYNSIGMKLSEWEFDRNIAVQLLRDSCPLIFSSVLVIIYVRTDQIMIKHMIGDSAVGQYTAALKLSEAWYFFPMIITASVFPGIIGIREKNRELYLKRLQQLYDMMVWFAIIVSLLIVISSKLIVTVLYGDAYLKSVYILRIHILSILFGSIGLVSNRYFTAENMQTRILYRSILGVSMNIVLNYFLIVSYGAAGAALAVVITQFSTSIVYTYLDKGTREVFSMSIKAFDVHRIVRQLCCKNSL